ncbi:MAG: tRNA 2-thiouridine(34) synthase MnmA, partial [Hydrogenobacter thermophilus]|nr:tRNA 2-thiouridine(34) synthase MnmA [Hydrogenobacter thermophilus]
HSSGKVMGKHTGIHNFTVGQRKGLGVAYHEPLYVLQIDAKENKVVVGEKEKLYRDSLKLLYLNTHMPINQWEDVYAVVRYRSKPVRVKDIRETQDGGYLVEFEEKVWGITPGQVCAFYEGDVLLGGGIIAQV